MNLSVWYCHQVSLAALRADTGNSYLGAVEGQLQWLLDGGKAEKPSKHAAKETAAVVMTIIQALRLYACVFRSSLRRSR